VSITTIVSTTAQLLATLAGAHAGDVIKLAPGTYSNVSIFDKNITATSSATFVIIESEEANKPAVLTDLKLNKSAGLYFSGLTFSTATTPESPYGGASTIPFSVYSSSSLVFTGINVAGTSAETYNTDATGLLFENSSHIVVRNSSFQYLHEGIYQTGNNWVTLQNNTFTDIADDCIRGGGTSNITITGNTFSSQHADASDMEHPDAIQFWTSNTTSGASNITITNNTITRGTGNAAQGIFLSDQVGTDPYTNVVIQGNTITGELYNGIYLENAISSKILDNTAVSYPDYTSAIKVLNSTGVAVDNNSAGYYDYVNDTNLTTASDTVTAAVMAPGGTILASSSLFSGSGNGLSQSYVFAAPVPEPATWSMMLLGATVCGGLLRRRRPRRAVSA
jgi:parallel beta-helix repeat protein